METRNFMLNSDNIDNLKDFRQILNKDYSTMINEALENYFQIAHKELIEKKLADENSQTNLDFNEFWDDVDL